MVRLQGKAHFHYSVLAKPGQLQPRGRKEFSVAVDILPSKRPRRTSYLGS